MTVAGYVASPSEELFDEAIRYATQEDREAFDQLLRSGKAIMLKDGIPVEIIETKILSGKIKIRPRGSQVELWTVSEAVR